MIRSKGKRNERSRLKKMIGKEEKALDSRKKGQKKDCLIDTLESRQTENDKNDRSEFRIRYICGASERDWVGETSRGQER